MKFSAAILGLVLAFVVVNPASAAPFNGNNHNHVAYYDSGSHAIVGLNGSSTVFWEEGVDLVMSAGNSGNFQQWFENDEVGYHSVWRHVGEDISCPSGWAFIEDANSVWGDYLWDGNYCVKTNQYNPGN